MADKGRLKIQCFVGDTYVPVDGSNITLVSTSGQTNDNKEVNLVTNSSGESQVIECTTIRIFSKSRSAYTI